MTARQASARTPRPLAPARRAAYQNQRITVSSSSVARHRARTFQADTTDLSFGSPPGLAERAARVPGAPAATAAIEGDRDPCEHRRPGDPPSRLQRAYRARHRRPARRGRVGPRRRSLEVAKVPVLSTNPQAYARAEIAACATCLARGKNLPAWRGRHGADLNGQVSDRRRAPHTVLSTHAGAVFQSLPIASTCAVAGGDDWLAVSVRALPSSGFCLQPL